MGVKKNILQQDLLKLMKKDNYKEGFQKQVTTTTKQKETKTGSTHTKDICPTSNK